jgi:hypothetical protein
MAMEDEHLTCGDDEGSKNESGKSSDEVNFEPRVVPVLDDD